MSLNIYYMSFNILNNICMLWNFYYMSLNFLNNIYILEAHFICYTIKTSHSKDMFLIFVCSTPRPMSESSPDTVSNFSVSQCDHTCSMVGCHNNFSTASPQRDYMSQLTLSHDNLANSCG